MTARAYELRMMRGAEVYATARHAKPFPQWMHAVDREKEREQMVRPIAVSVLTEPPMIPILVFRYVGVEVDRTGTWVRYDLHDLTK